MSATSLFSKFTGFVSHYASELSSIVEALNTLTNALPIDAGDKSSILDTIGTLRDSVANIATALANTTPVPDVIVKESDLETAVKNFLSSAEGKALLGNLQTPPSGNVNNA